MSRVKAINCYQDCVKLWGTCRFPDKGKPINSGSLRLFKKGDTFEIAYCWGRKNVTVNVFAKIVPQQIVTFVGPRPYGAYTRDLFNIYATSVGKGRCRIASWDQIPTYKFKDGSTGKDLWGYLRKEAPEYFDGIQFDLKTGKCLNRRVDLLKSVDTDKRAEWLRKTKKFRKQLLTRVKLGAFEGRFMEIFHGDGPYKNWVTRQDRLKAAGDLLYENLMAETFSDDLLDALTVQIGNQSWWNNQMGAKWPGTARASSILLGLLNSHSFDMRKKFGVFIDPAKGPQA